MSLKQKWRDARPALFSALAYHAVRLLGRTWRVKIEGTENVGEKAIVCGWHGRTMPYLTSHAGRGVIVLISLSKDGDIQNEIYQRMGYRVIRGSTGRGGDRAAVEVIRTLRKGGVLAMTPDGPRGPSGQVQGGILLFARKTGATLVPSAGVAKWAWFAKSWDRFMVPLPFSPCLILFGEPIEIAEDADEAETERVRAELERRIHRIQEEADRRIGRPTHPRPALPSPAE